ncbi:MAG: hypothetical protein HOQ28_09345, partial [Thermoleophilia bacterium]|nr:hypothetical protein [Thermoleophilia bacterium]
MKAEAINRARTHRAHRPHPQLAPGAELIGEYRGSGFRETPYIIRRADGRVLQLTRLLYLVAGSCDGERDHAGIADEVSGAYGRRISAANVAYLIEQKLQPLGVLGDGPTGDERAPGGPLALTMRSAVVPPAVVRPLAALLRPLFAPLLVGAAIAWLVAIDVWLFHHGLHGAIVELFSRPALLLLLFALMIASTAFHELGHAAACRYGGARPGAMGVGLYFVWPAFYTDVTDAYRLDRVGRLRTDLGGVYFNALFALGAAAAYFRTGFEPLLLVVAFEQVQIMNQLVPWGRFDGYYVLTDLTGVPDILSRLRPVLLSLIPDRAPEPRVAELKPWVRVVVSAYVLTLFPAMLLLLALIARSVPHLLAFANLSLRMQSVRIGAALAHRDLTTLTLSVLQILVLLLTLAAVALTLGRTALAATRIVSRPLRKHRRARRLAVAAAAIAA